MNTEQQKRCGTCQHFQKQLGRCAKLKMPVRANMEHCLYWMHGITDRIILDIKKKDPPDTR